MTPRLKKILNRSEDAVDELLAEYADSYGYRINIKMRLRDVIDVDDRQLDPRARNFVWTSHLDFVIIDATEKYPILAVEYDGLHI